MATNNLTLALECLGRGWPVIAIGDNGKATPATRDIAKVREMFAGSDAVAIPTGTASGALVICVHNATSMLRLIAEQGAWPQTAIARAAMGWTLFFNMPDGSITQGMLAPGVFFRGDGAYVLAPEKWVRTEIVDAPNWLLELARKNGSRPL
jgi:Bifunctional DNA primase/polymerase, N-terminal